MNSAYKIGYRKVKYVSTKCSTWFAYRVNKNYGPEHNLKYIVNKMWYKRYGENYIKI